MSLGFQAPPASTQGLHPLIGFDLVYIELMGYSSFVPLGALGYSGMAVRAFLTGGWTHSRSIKLALTALAFPILHNLS